MSPHDLLMTAISVASLAAILLGFRVLGRLDDRDARKRAIARDGGVAIAGEDGKGPHGGKGGSAIAIGRGSVARGGRGGTV